MPEVKVTVKRDNKENDIFYAGNFVKGEDGTVLLVIDELPKFSNCFGGVLIFKGKKQSRLLGYYSTSWDKSMFTQFQGEITITV